ncbi:hypothetical protein ASZ90_017632 [hydrocarbon metagenome]|uniref:Uncharacterized protein n=1 Tax=hydrocarbon metagenome TaxID=938273 RepID=A0A0W8E8R5_9ZZZZ
MGNTKNSPPIPQGRPDGIFPDVPNGPLCCVLNNPYELLFI